MGCLANSTQFAPPHSLSAGAGHECGKAEDRPKAKAEDATRWQRSRAIRRTALMLISVAETWEGVWNTIKAGRPELGWELVGYTSRCCRTLMRLRLGPAVMTTSARFGAAATLLIAGLLLPASHGHAVDLQTVNDAQWRPGWSAKSAIDPVLIKGQVLLARAWFSPGEIDGKHGDNFRKAIAAFAAENGLQTSDRLTEQVWTALVSTSNDVILKEYVIVEDDVKGPFVERIPAKMEEMKDLPTLGYRSAREKIAEKFQMNEDLLADLNAGQKFDQSGQRIIVANVAMGPLPQKVARIEVDKTKQTLKAFDRSDKFVAFYPVTAGSAEKPAPNGRLKITRVSKNPTYRYNPAYAFRGVKTQQPFTIKPGPNNPVGLVWIALSAEGYGIHGTPDPAKVSKSESHGCIRLTNWDALQLASAVAKGVPVDFTGDEMAREPKTKRTRAKRRQ